MSFIGASFEQKADKGEISRLHFGVICTRTVFASEQLPTTFFLFILFFFNFLCAAVKYHFSFLLGHLFYFFNIFMISLFLGQKKLSWLGQFLLSTFYGREFNFHSMIHIWIILTRGAVTFLVKSGILLPCWHHPFWLSSRGSLTGFTATYGGSDSLFSFWSYPKLISLQSKS